MSDQERLAAFERMLADVQKNYAEFSVRMEKLKAEGKEKSATFRQYWSNKITMSTASLSTQIGMKECRQTVAFLVKLNWGESKLQHTGR